MRVQILRLEYTRAVKYIKNSNRSKVNKIVMNIIKSITIIGAATLFIAGCGDTHIVASVDGHDITKAEFNAF